MEDFNEMINKSLDDIDALVGDIKNEDTISKAQTGDDLNADDVSDNAPAEEEDGEEGGGDEPEQDTDDTDVDADAEAEEDASEDEEVEKSLENELKSDDNVRKALEVSDFLDTLVKSISGKLDAHSTNITAHNEDLAKSLQASEQSNELLAKSLMGMVKGQKAILEQNVELQKSVRVLNKRLKAIEAQPQVRKSVQSTAQPINKSFQASAGGSATPEKPSLSKSQISGKLFEGVEAGKIDANDVLAFEGTGRLESLSEQARNYIQA